MKSTRRVRLTALLLPFSPLFCGATTYYVAPTGSDASAGTGWAAATETIQAAVDLAIAGDTVIVSNGVYASGSRAVSGFTLPNRVLIDKAITVESLNGPDVTVIEGVSPIGPAAVRCVYLADGATLSGFTLTNGAVLNSGSYFPDRSAGGVYCPSTSAFVTNCILTGNSGDSGGGALRGTFNSCTLTNNTAVNWGGGARASTLNHCTVSGNQAGDNGGGVYQCEVNHCTLAGNQAADSGGGARVSTLNDCLLTNNVALVSGGGAFGGTLNHCILTGNQANDFGGGALDAALNNCVLVNNTAVYDGGGANGGTLNNCTVTANSADTGGGVNGAALNNSIVYLNTATTQGANYDSSTFTNSCTTPLPVGSGNIAADPLFAGANDLRLQPASPCINAGNGSVFGAVDLDGNPRIIGGIVDMGSYESAAVVVTVFAGGATTTGSGNYLPGASVGISALAPNAHFTFTNWNDGSTELNRTITVPSTSVTYTAFFSANIGAVTTYVAVASSNPVWPYTSWATAATNIQDAIDAVLYGDSVIVSNGVYATGGRPAQFSSLTNRVVIDEGITVQSLNGPAVTIIEGTGPIGNSAVRCAYVDNNATLSGFTLTNGATRSSGDYSRDRSGGGIYGEYDAVITNCTLTGNQADNFGGGSIQGELYHCTLTGNQANAGGGSYQGTLIHCTLTGNQADYGGGAGLCLLDNCILSGNQAAIDGGGANGGYLSGCTVTGNQADNNGGGTYECSGVNSIVYFNTANSSFYVNDYRSYFTYSCTTPIFGGTGNITNAPLFTSTNDFHLLSGSPGINAGNNYNVNSSTDLDGNPRIGGGVVDMGAYESPAVIVTVDANGGTGIGSGLYFSGESINISAQGLNAHYSLTSWTDGDTNRFRTITVPTSNSTFTASFTENIADSFTAYVAISNATPVWPYASWVTAATNIQDAVDATGYGYDDTVIVSNGVYATGGRPVEGGSLSNRVLIAKDITVQSLNGPDVTIIEGAGPIGGSAVRCVYLDYDATLSGFTLTNGATWHRYSGGYNDDSGGGVYCEYNAVVTNCTLTGNRADNYGGGSYQGELSHCTITGNWAAEYGGGAYYGTLRNCLLTDNTAHTGGGMAAATLYNCTVTGNEALSGGGGANGGSMYNCIVYYNTASYDANYDLASFYSSCTTPMPSGGYNITTNPPMFVGTNDYHLLAASPCIDEGDNGNAYGIAADLDGSPRIVGSVVDMGAYESPYVGVRVVNADGTTMGSGNFLPGTSNVTISAVSTNAHAFFRAWNDGDTSMPRSITVPANTITYTAIFTQYLGSVMAHVSLSNPNPVPPYRTWATAATDLHVAMDALLDGDIVIASNGVYAVGSRTVGNYALPNRVAITKALTVQSLNGPDVTSIQGAGPIGPAAVRCAYVGPNAILSGFTLTNGAALATGAFFEEMSAGGAYCATGAVLTNCTLIGNSGASGGAVYSGTLNHCTLTDNWAANWGGAARSSTFNDSLLFNNGAELQGGAVFQGTLNHCILSNNWAMLEGGGAAFAELNQCLLTGNEADQGGGAYDSTLNHCTLEGNTGYNNGGGATFSTLNNCLLINNSSYYGGGARGGVLNNCTVVQNWAEILGGGTYQSSVNNCIVYHNEANMNSENPSTDPNANHYNSTFAYSCTYPGPGFGEGNIAADPQFVGAGDSRLQLGSLCIDAGNHAYTNSLTDLNGDPRIVDGTVDMGAYEYQSIIIATDPPVLTGLTALGDGTFQFGFTNLTEASFTVLGTTNLALPLIDWTDLGPAAETPPGSGQFQVTYPATNYPHYFYRVLSP